MKHAYGKKLAVNYGAKMPKASWSKSVAHVPQGSPAPGPHYGHEKMIPMKARIKGQ